MIRKIQFALSSTGTRSAVRTASTATKISANVAQIAAMTRRVPGGSPVASHWKKSAWMKVLTASPESNGAQCHDDALVHHTPAKGEPRERADG